MTIAQKKAANPRSSVWVGASAGTGKTKVLTDRVLRLLLDGNDPSKILCLTFTNAAAVEMSNRINKVLANWVIISDENLSQEIINLTGDTPSSEVINNARCLFAKIVDDDNNFKIQTIHAFCQSLIKKFPIEIGVAPHFEILDEKSSLDLINKSRQQYFIQASKDEQMVKIILDITKYLNEETLDELLQEIIDKRSKIENLFNRFSQEEIIFKIYDQFGLNVNDTESNIVNQFCKYCDTYEMELKNAAKILLDSNATDQKRGSAILDWLNLNLEERAKTYREYVNIYLTKDKLEKRKKLVSKKISDNYANISDLLSKEQNRLGLFIENIKSVNIAKSSSDLIIILQAIYKNYNFLKEQKSALDYNDLIIKTQELLLNSEAKDWILYKLDGGIDHILVDEAQDTSFEQWQVILAICEDFFSGSSAHEVEKTIFVVGDEKQSIYSFQGADPNIFNEMKLLFSQKIENAKKTWSDIDLDTSFRSTEAVLKCVDHIFSKEDARKSITVNANIIKHNVFRKNFPGLVELWPLQIEDEQQNIDPWQIYKEKIKIIDPKQKIAQQIVSKIKTWLNDKKILASKQRIIQPGDIMILLRRRNILVDYIIKELKDNNIAVVGKDRLVINDNLAVKDLMALARFVLLPEDDLNLAVILKSPFICMEEEDLFNLCYNRGDESLWSILKDNKDQKSIYNKAYDFLIDVKKYGNDFKPFEFFSYILENRGGWKELLRRLGNEIIDPVNEFLSLSMSFERRELPSLQDFIYWVDDGDIEIKRDLEQNISAVRIMTVHGSKGLQAPIVFMPDTVQTPKSADKILWNEDGIPIWINKIENENIFCKELKKNKAKSELDEYLRLLYVALTRAEDELYILGEAKKEKIVQNCWYNIIKESLIDIGVKAKDNIYRLSSGVIRQDFNISENNDDLKLDVIGDDILKMPKYSNILLKRDTASSNEFSNIVEDDLKENFADRGTIIHKIMQIIADINISAREQFIDNYLQKQSKIIDSQDAKQIKENILKILNNEKYKSYFLENSKAEVPIIGNINSQVVSAQIDRLVVEEDKIIIIDYKTDYNNYKNCAKTRSIYQKQLNIYKQLIANIYPNKQIFTEIIFI